MSEQAENLELIQPVEKPRRIWLAALLGLLAGVLAQVYVGRFRRAVILWVGFNLLQFVLCFVLVTFRFPYILASFVVVFLLYHLFIVVDACLIAKRDRYAPLKRYQRWWVYLLIYLSLYPINYGIAYTFKTFICEAFTIPTRSMAPTVQAGDRILVDKFWVDPSKVKRKDLIVFYPNLPDSDPFIMRVIGLPDETVEIKDNRVFIDGEPLEEPYASFDAPKPVVPDYVRFSPQSVYAKMFNYGPEKVPDDCFFVLGDNRYLAKDSRFIGPVPFSDYIGTARVIYWSRKYIFSESEYDRRVRPGPIQWDRFGKRLDDNAEDK